MIAMALAVAGCKVYDPLYCDEDRPCTDPDRSYCDLRGEHSGSGGIGRTCIADPFGGKKTDGGFGMDASPVADGGMVDAGACRWSRLSKLANVGDGGGIGAVDAEGLTIYFHREDSFWRATRESPTQPFGNPVALDFDADGLAEPEISSTGLEAFFRIVEGDVIASATRPTLDAAFVGRDPTGLSGLHCLVTGYRCTL